MYPELTEIGITGFRVGLRNLHTLFTHPTPSTPSILYTPCSARWRQIAVTVASDVAWDIG